MMSVDDLLLRVLASAPEVPDVVAVLNLMSITRDFCRRTRAWQADLDPVDFVAGQARYALALPEESALLDFISVVDAAGRPIEKRTAAQLDRQQPGWRTRSGTPAYCRIDGRDGLVLTPTPAAAATAGALVRAALLPTASATTLDERFADLYGDALIDGTLGQLYAIPRKPWSSQPLAGYHTARYLAARDEASARAADEGMVGVARTVVYGGL